MFCDNVRKLQIDCIQLQFIIGDKKYEDSPVLLHNIKYTIHKTIYKVRISAKARESFSKIDLYHLNNILDVLKKYNCIINFEEQIELLEHITSFLRVFPD